MEGLRITFLLLIVAVSSNANIQPKTKEVRTTALSDKIIGGVIDLVHSHKNKPSTQQNVQQTYPNQVYPPYQWNGQSNYQGQGFNYNAQFQNQNQAQYGNYQTGYAQTTYPQNGGNYGTGLTYPPPPPPAGFSNGQAQSQGQYQIVYQNVPSNPPQYTQTTGQFPLNQGTGTFQGSQTTGIYQGQNPSGNYQGTQSTGIFQGQNPSGNYQGTQATGIYQGQNPSGSYQGTQSTGIYQPQNPTGNYHNQQGHFQGQTGTFPTQGITGTESGSHNQGFQTSGGHQTSGNPQGPTCVCQAWTKPSEVLNDPAADKIEKIGNEPAM